ncbi:MAG: hypothetical protein IJA10_04580 [Lachnospiraceae bacterium]|nr:hypothetical protein [Lachnospiraceae bacterium]
MRKRKKVFLLVTIFLLVLLAGCISDSPEQKKINKQNIEQAKINAQNYIEQKYGFTAEITDAILERQHGIFGSSPRSTVLVKMQYDGKEFNVYIDGANVNIDGADDYQVELITESIESFFTELIPGECSIYLLGGDVRVSYDEIENEFDIMFSNYFDGTNFDEVLGKSRCEIVAEYVQQDFSSLGEECFSNKMFSSENIYVTFISYRSHDCMQMVGRDHSNDEKYVVYIDNDLSINNGVITKKTYEIGHFDDFYYYVPGGVPEDVTFRKIVPDDEDCWDGHGIIDGTFLTDAYSVNCDYECEVYIYYPWNELENLPTEKISMTICREKEGEKKYSADVSMFCNVGEYIVYEIPVEKDDSLYFAFMKK